MRKGPEGSQPRLFELTFPARILPNRLTNIVLFFKFVVFTTNTDL